MLITLRGKIKKEVFITEDGVCIPLKYKYEKEFDDVFINCAFNDDGTLSIYKTFKIK